MNQPGVKGAHVRRSDGHARLSQLDGLRALAILMVVGFHVAGLSWGWTGVQIFFVLSGFLITGILRHSRNALHFWGPFYIKRVTRILPPLVIFFAIMERSISAICGAKILPPDTVSTTARSRRRCRGR